MYVSLERVLIVLKPTVNSISSLSLTLSTAVSTAVDSVISTTADDTMSIAADFSYFSLMWN